VDDEVIDLVRDIIARYGIDVSVNARRLENFLADLSKKRRLENAALVAAVKEGIPAELRAGSAQAVPGLSGDRFVQLLREHQGLDANVARWAVRAWAQALDVTGLRFRAPVPATERTPERGGQADSVGAAAVFAYSEIARLTGKAMVIVHTITDPRAKALALAILATVAAHRDRDDATGLLDSAESLAGSIPSRHDRTLTLHAIALTIVEIEPDRAEALARSLLHLRLADSVVSRLAGSLIAADPDRALRLAWSIRQPALQASALIAVASALAQADPGRAERLAGSLDGNYWRAEALSAVAAEVAGTEPDRAGRLADEAERLARGVPDGSAKVAALASAARARHFLNADRAAEMFEEAKGLAFAMERGNDQSSGSAFGSLAIALIESNPGRALAFCGLSSGWYPGAELARRLVATDPVRAIGLVQSLASPRALISQSAVLVEIARTVAQTDPDEALRLAWSIECEPRRAQALAAIARTLMLTDQDRAARLLADVERSAEHLNIDWPLTVDFYKVQVLADVAGAWAGEL
jgi:hypothetical protein